MKGKWDKITKLLKNIRRVLLKNWPVKISFTMSNLTSKLISCCLSLKQLSTQVGNRCRQRDHIDSFSFGAIPVFMHRTRWHRLEHSQQKLFGFGMEIFQSFCLYQFFTLRYSVDSSSRHNSKYSMFNSSRDDN